MKAGVVAFAFGVPASIQSNRRIAEIAINKASQLSASVYTQRDVPIEAAINIQHIKEQKGQPPPTLRIARGAVKWAGMLELTELWIVAAQPHLWRARRDLISAAKEARLKIEIHVCEGIYQYSIDSWFCPDSTQTRTTARKAWEKRENILRIMPFFIYKRVAS